MREDKTKEWAECDLDLKVEMRQKEKAQLRFSHAHIFPQQGQLFAKRDGQGMSCQGPHRHGHGYFNVRIDTL